MVVHVSTRLTGTQDENKQGDLRFLLQYFNVPYTAFKCVEFENNCMSFQGNYPLAQLKPRYYVTEIEGAKGSRRWYILTGCSY